MATGTITMVVDITRAEGKVAGSITKVRIIIATATTITTTNSTMIIKGKETITIININKTIIKITNKCNMYHNRTISTGKVIIKSLINFSKIKQHITNKHHNRHNRQPHLHLKHSRRHRPWHTTQATLRHSYPRTKQIQKYFIQHNHKKNRQCR